MKEELKPCPFCAEGSPIEAGKYAGCTCGGQATKERWNHRPVEDALRADLAAAVASAEKANAEREWLANEIARRCTFGDYRTPEYWLEEAEYQVAAKREDDNENDE